MKRSSATADASWPELLSLARDLFGESLTFVILTGERWPARTVNVALVDQRETDRSALSAALEIAESLLALEMRSTIQAWFVGKNSLLDDRSPALVVRTDPEAVREAARHFAAYG